MSELKARGHWVHNANLNDKYIGIFDVHVIEYSAFEELLEALEWCTNLLGSHHTITLALDDFKQLQEHKQTLAKYREGRK